MRNENIVASVRSDIENERQKHATVDKEIAKIDELVGEVNSMDPEPEAEA